MRAAERITKLATMIQDGARVNASTAAQMLGVCARTAARDIADLHKLAAALGWQMVYSYKGKRYELRRATGDC